MPTSVQVNQSRDGLSVMSGHERVAVCCVVVCYVQCAVCSSPSTFAMQGQLPLLTATSLRAVREWGGRPGWDTLTDSRSLQGSI